MNDFTKAELELIVNDKTKCEHEYIPAMHSCGLWINHRCRKCGYEPEINKISTEPFPPEFNKFVEDHFWELLA